MKTYIRFLFFIFLIGCSPQVCTNVEPAVLPEGSIEYHSEEAVTNNTTFTPVEWIPIDWWNYFEDSQLDNYIRTAIAKNPTLEKAQMQILVALYKADAVKAALYPNVALSGSVQRNKLSKTGIIPSAPTTITIPGVPGGPGIPITPAMSIPFYFTLYQTQFTLFYDFDLWSKNRNTLCAAIGEYNASIADAALAQLSLSLSVAEVYFKLQTALERKRILERVVENNEIYLGLIEERVKFNVDTVSNVYTAQSELTTARQALYQVEAEIVINDAQLKMYLAGDFDEVVTPICLEEKAPIRAPLPENIPLNLISHRPDITAQLWLINSAGCMIEVAKAGYYPDFNLSGLGGLQTIRLKDLLEARSFYGFLGPAFSLPFFDGGLLNANLDSSAVNYDLAILEYNHLVQKAAKEVIEGIGLVQIAQKQLIDFQSDVEYRYKNYQLSQERIAGNVGTRLDSILKEQAFLTAKDGELVAIGNKLQALLKLFKALGGGYDTNGACCYCEME